MRPQIGSYFTLEFTVWVQEDEIKMPSMSGNWAGGSGTQQLQQKYDQEALAVFKSQSETFKQEIAKADNPELKNYYQKLLNTCHKIWAEKILKIELREENNPISESPLSSTFQQQLDAIYTKLVLLSEKAHIEDEGTVAFAFGPRKQKLKEKCII